MSSVPFASSAGRYDIVAELGQDRAGRIVRLARIARSPTAPTVIEAVDDLIILISKTPRNASPSLTPTPGPTEETVAALDRGAIPAARACYACDAPRSPGARYCDVCGATLSVSLEGAAASSHTAARRGALGAQLALLGAIPTTDGQLVYMARDAQDARALALVPSGASEPPNGPEAVASFDAMPAIAAIEPSLPAPPAASAGNVAADATRVQLDPTGSADGDPLLGRLLDDKYRIVRLLGQGGMGRVYEAAHEQLRARRAIKVMNEQLKERPDLVARFYEEARNAERVKQEHVCAVYDFGESDGLIYLVMEFVDGEPLSALLRRDRTLPAERASGVVTQTAAALDAAHALGIIHRDIKPDNIMLCRRAEGRTGASGAGDDVRVVDFGISKALNRSELTGAAGPTPTQYGVVIGTLDYMSDEQRRGEEIDTRTDVYALGRTAVKMLTGDLPEHGEAAWRAWGPGRVPAAIVDALAPAFAPRDQRYRTAGELAQKLAAALVPARSSRRLGGWFGASRPGGATAIRWRPAIALAGLTLVAATAGVALARRGSRHGTPVSDTTGKAVVVQPPDPCTAPRAQLAHIRTLTDPLSGTAADARHVVDLVPALSAALCTPDERVEAQLRLAEAYLILQQPSRACATLRAVQRDAATTSFDRNVRVYLAQCR